MNSQLVRDLVLANRILAAHGVLDGYGHVSVRSAPDRFLLSRSLAPELVTGADILEFGLDSEPLQEGERVYSERFIHGEIYRARPEVGAVVHSHSPSVIPFGTIDRPLRPIYHMAGFLGTGVPVFEIRDVKPGSDMLVSSTYLGAALARRLGGSSAALMRGHGCVVAAETLPLVVGRSIYLELNAKLQGQAMLLSEHVVYLDDEEAANAAAMNDFSRAWQLWRRKAEQELELEA